MPAPIMPAPSTPILSSLVFGASLGLRSSLLAFCMLMKSERIMLREAGCIMTLVM
jgi:hypothetical protein